MGLFITTTNPEINKFLANQLDRAYGFRYQDLKKMQPELQEAEVSVFYYGRPLYTGPYRNMPLSTIYSKLSAISNSPLRKQCIDCNTNILCNDEFDIRRSQFVVHDELWFSQFPICYAGMVCLACFEKRIGRPLTIHDFPMGVPCNVRMQERLDYLHNFGQVEEHIKSILREILP